MTRKLLAIFAHPDDEAFGPGGTFAYYAQQGVEIHLLCVTKGEAGENADESQIANYGELRNSEKKRKFASTREKELLRSAKILGIDRVEFLGFTDGMLSNAIYHQLSDKIIKKIKKFRPQVVLTNERRGVSGHLDHIATSMVTTYAFLRSKIAKKLYYFCLPKEFIDKKRQQGYFVYFPEGYKQEDITTRIEYGLYWEKRIEAIKAHKSQIKDVKVLIARYKKLPKVDHFILHHHQGVKVEYPENDLFARIKD